MRNGDEDIMYEPVLDDLDVVTLRVRMKTILKLKRGHETGCEA